MTRAVQGLSIRPDWVWVDGNHFPKGLLVAQYAGGSMIKGDAKEPAVSLNIDFNKVARDADCLRLHNCIQNTVLRNTKAIQQRRTSKLCNNTAQRPSTA